MTTSMQSARADAPRVPPGAQAEPAFASGQWVPVAWGIVVVLCLAFWIGLVGLLVALS